MSEAARAVLAEFEVLEEEPADVWPWLDRLAAAAGFAGALSDPFGDDSARTLARAFDAVDPLAPMRRQFHIPKAAAAAAGTKCVYLTGHSLGLQPVSTADAVQARGRGQ